jgi:hypothetical protein
VIDEVVNLSTSAVLFYPEVKKLPILYQNLPLTLPLNNGTIPGISYVED